MKTKNLLAYQLSLGRWVPFHTRINLNNPTALKNADSILALGRSVGRALYGAAPEVTISDRIKSRVVHPVDTPALKWVVCKYRFRQVCIFIIQDKVLIKPLVCSVFRLVCGAGV